MLRAIPRMATAVAHDAGTACQLRREPFLAVVLGHARQSLAVGTHGRSAAGRRRRAGRQYAAARPQLAVGMIVTSGSGMESEP
jgi:hypothetical protein